MNRKPNIMITGTPGTGKSTLGRELADRTGLKYINVGELAKENNFFDGFDQDLVCPVIDEDRVIDEMEEDMNDGGVVVDYHGCDFFPKRWFDLVIVLRTDNTKLYERLEKRGYKGKKLRENIECEIFGTLLEEAQEAYDRQIVQEVKNDTPDDMEDNLTKIQNWLEQRIC
ncbi:DgyrCDS2788 [Dimorphilus gyrociliatus]|uniref:Adenylate kinase isoenzyme 6 homolog n=1 Tax=Dimorphilus gyrociliatus TaxID=2664684 RepID=A0A7I8VBB3_9ANNE|nr:DgyrCDS2788 [Dimorphilus gyrociliatus]